MLFRSPTLAPASCTASLGEVFQSTLNDRKIQRVEKRWGDARIGSVEVVEREQPGEAHDGFNRAACGPKAPLPSRRMPNYEDPPLFTPRTNYPPWPQHSVTRKLKGTAELNESDSFSQRSRPRSSLLLESKVCSLYTTLRSKVVQSGSVAC